MNDLFQLIEPISIKQTRDIEKGILTRWITEIAGKRAASEVQIWTEQSGIGDTYEGKNFKVVNRG